MDHEHSETERVRRLWDRFAGKYDRTIGVAENFFFRGGRAWACGQASGKVLEVAAGTGLNLQHYPPGTDLTAIDISEKMLGFAVRRQAASVSRPRSGKGMPRTSPSRTSHSTPLC